MNGNIVKIESEETLFKMVSSLIENSRKHIAKTISATTVSTYYEIGHYVVEYEQQGCLRASYGKQVVKNLSDRLTIWSRMVCSHSYKLQKVLCGI